jgi:hypothetical protein
VVTIHCAVDNPALAAIRSSPHEPEAMSRHSEDR